VNERNNKGLRVAITGLLVLGSLLALSCGIVWRPEFYAFILGVLRA
jgi:hypothetical protein